MEGSIMKIKELIVLYAKAQRLVAKDVYVDGDTFFAACIPDTDDWVIAENPTSQEGVLINTVDDPVEMPKAVLEALLQNLR
jgi:negative regulator of replication initiation